MAKSTQELCDKIVFLLEEKKAEHIKIMDMHGKSILADFFIIASVQSSRQLYAIAEYLKIELKALGLQPIIDGKPPSDWVVVDAHDIIVHLFRIEARDYYGLEKMWDIDLPFAPTS